MISIYVYAAVAAVIGAISCFFGKRLYFPILMLTVFLSTVTAVLSLDEVTWQLVLIAVVLGLVFAVLAKVFYNLGVFLIGALLGSGIGMLISFVLPEELKDYRWVAALIFAVLLGICAVRWCSLFIMAATAYNGASVIILPIAFIAVKFQSLQDYVFDAGALETALGVNTYVHGPFKADAPAAVLLAVIVLAVIGFIFQYTKDKKGE